jgi:phosphoribosylglycinamide formyltransferase-1
MSLKQSRIAVFASGAGTNAEAVFKYFKDHPSIRVVLLLTNNPAAPALQRAKQHDVKTFVFDRSQFSDGSGVQACLKENGVTHLVLAGFLWLIPAHLLANYPDRIINIHPALLPKYGGKGMYGRKVHEAVKASGDLVTGITIHLVNSNYDEGRVLFQAQCNLSPDDNPQQIAACVHKLEHEHYPRIIKAWIEEALSRKPKA